MGRIPRYRGRAQLERASKRRRRIFRLRAMTARRRRRDARLRLLPSPELDSADECHERFCG